MYYICCVSLCDGNVRVFRDLRLRFGQVCYEHLKSGSGQSVHISGGRKEVPCYYLSLDGVNGQVLVMGGGP